ncbi:uncharacterized protein EAF01_000987 [Botrytis porri]|uniref:Uncharacterized protein n=1 Tax=Botrytis porri TaxID=87229 RepID=A0A4Z1KHZ9_9HELO|nr:uncharacterized protein EAF01_000987 [Botrytis porri]KAF7914581.1 hypothetical protein EAF01_000987 [Botrytis porri]TGO81087.1 hypothetical protein BPOR_1361g00010 [Botrytis porri]
MNFVKCLLVASVADRASAASSAYSPATIALYLGVQAGDVTDLMNTTDYVNIDATKWAVTFNQYTEDVAAWSPVTKERVFLDRVSCLSDIACVLCIGAAIAGATGPIAACASTAYAAIAATAAETAGATIPPIILTFASCALPFVASGLGVASACIEYLGA